MPEDINGGYHLNSDDALKSSANILDARERDEQQQRLNNLGGGGGGSKGGSGMGGAGAFLGILLWIVKVIPKYLSIFLFFVLGYLGDKGFIGRVITSLLGSFGVGTVIGGFFTFGLPIVVPSIESTYEAVKFINTSPMPLRLVFIAIFFLPGFIIFFKWHHYTLGRMFEGNFLPIVQRCIEITLYGGIGCNFIRGIFGSHFYLRELFTTMPFFIAVVYYIIKTRPYARAGAEYKNRNGTHSSWVMNENDRHESADGPKINKFTVIVLIVAFIIAIGIGSNVASKAKFKKEQAAILTSAKTAADKNVTAIVTKHHYSINVNGRKGTPIVTNPVIVGMSNNAVVWLLKGDALTITGEVVNDDNYFGKSSALVPVEYKGEKGYIATEYIRIVKPSEKAAVDKREKEKTTKQEAKQAAEAVYVSQLAASLVAKTLHNEAAEYLGTEIMTIPPGAFVTIKSISGAWAEVDYKGTTGWVKNIHILKPDLSAKTAKEVSLLAEPEYYTDKIKTIKKGEKVTLLGKGSDVYIYIEHDGDKGWVHQLGIKW